MKLLFKSENFTPKNHCEEQSEGRTTNKDSLHLNTNSERIYYKIESSEISYSKTQNYFKALNSLCVSLDNINEKDIFEDINEYSQTNPNQTKDENVSKYIHRPLIKEFIKNGNNLKLNKPIKRFGTSINNLYSFNYNLSSIFEQLKYKRNEDNFRMNLTSKNNLIKTKIINKIQASKIKNINFLKEKRNSIKQEISIKANDKNEKDIFKKNLKNSNKTKIEGILNKLNYLKMKNNNKKVKINKENKIFNKINSGKHLELKTEMDNKKRKKGLISTKIIMEPRKTISRNKMNTILAINIEKNTYNKNYLKDTSEISTVRDEFNKENIKLNYYIESKEYSSFESKSNIIKNLLNDFNSSSNRMNLDNSSILDLYKIN